MAAAVVAAMLGACGSDGSDGRDGVDGTKGADGADGRDGVDGAKGADGADGRDGVDGAKGADGADGRDGRDGTNGLSALVNISEELQGANCPRGGNRIEYGQDTNGNAVLDADEVTGTQFTCNGEPPVTYSIGGAVEGLSGTLVLQNNSDGYLVLSGDGSFTFRTSVDAGDAYAVSVLTQPRGQTCTVSNGTGNAVANVTGVRVSCAGNALVATDFGPLAGGADVERTVEPWIVFNTGLDLSTAIPANVLLSSAAGDQPLSVRVSGTQLTATPTRELLPATVYRMRAVHRLTGNAGETMAADLEWQFTTRDGQWKPAMTVDTHDLGIGSSFGPELAMDAQGNALAVWREVEGSVLRIWAHRYTAGVGWGNAMVINSASAPTSGLGPYVAMDPNGNGLAVWTQSRALGTRVWANRYTAGQGWGIASPIDNSTHDGAGIPSIGFDAAGNALVVWTQRVSSDPSDVWVNRYTLADGWGTPEVIDEAAVETIDPSVAVSASGNAIAVWSQFDGTQMDIWSSRFTPGEGWSTPIPVDTSGTRDLANNRVMMDADGNALAVWQRYVGMRADIWSSRSTAGGAWTPAALIEHDDRGSTGGVYDFVMDPNGNAIGAWTQDDGTRVNIVTNRYTAGVGWGNAMPLETNDQGFAYLPRLVVDVVGNALAVWIHDIGGTRQLWASRYTPISGVWSTAAPVERAHLAQFRAPAIAMDRSGNALATWARNDGGAARFVANRFE